MLIGAHVSPAGGLVKALERGVERDCAAIQIFNQSPRAWRTTRYGVQDFAAFREARAGGPIEAVVIHAVYLINAANKDPEIRRKSLESLTHALRIGDGIGAAGVVVHPGSAVGDPKDEAMARIVEAIDTALGETQSCPLLLEDTAGAGQTIGRTFEELAALIEGAADEHAGRLGVCLDCCHLLASGYDVSDAARLAAVVDDFESVVGLDRLRCLHVNDSQTGLGSNRDRHANLGDGELGREGIAAFLSEPRFDGLPAVLETPGREGKGPDAAEIAWARRLREDGIAARA
ncbi:MAG: deoxyribonuclease IV [Thermoleophilaceae bacterium]|jgi:deoxyribonuclease-4|nr:deoxyribonuclease IV [Thermoleophilaceae bacterium]